MRTTVRLLLALVLAASVAACKKDKDKDPPVVSTFTVPALSTTLAVPITAFVASDGVGVTGYRVTETAATPVGATGWTSTAPTSYTVAADGAYTLRAWARDAAGNVSLAREASVLVDTTPPAVTAFTIPATVYGGSAAISAFEASDGAGAGVNGYLVTASATAPAADDPAWTATPPTAFALSGRGAHTLHAWARDGAGHVSAARTAPVLSVTRLTVLFTTDEHSNLFARAPEADDFPLAAAAGTGALTGGVARRATLLTSERQEAAARFADTVTLSAGDFSQGTLASAAFLGAASGMAVPPELVLMKRLGYDAVALGNHEFDLGPAALALHVGLAAAAGEAPPLVLTNVQFDAASAADDALAALYGPGKPIAPTRIVTTSSGLRVGVVAVMGVSAGTVAAAAAPVRFWDAAAATTTAQFQSVAASAQAAVTSLRQVDGVDAVIVLGHGGIGAPGGSPGDDQRLASFVRGIDLLVSGHTHRSTAAPILVTDPDGRQVPVVQPKPYGDEVGRVELLFDGGARPAMDDARTAFLPVDDRILPTADAAVRTALADVVAYLEEGVPGVPQSFLERALSHVEGAAVVDDPAVAGDLYFRVLGHTAFDVIGLAPGETDAMNLDTDAMLAAAHGLGRTAVAALQATGSVRADLRAGKRGDLTFADLYRVVPLGGDPTVALTGNPATDAASLPALPGYPLVWAQVSAAELRAVLELTLQSATVDGDFFVAPAGLLVDYDMRRAPFSQASPLGPGWITRIATVNDLGVETGLLYDAALPAPSFAVSPAALQPVVTSYYIAAFAARFGVTLRDAAGAPTTPAAAILRRADSSAVKDHEALAAYVKQQCAASGGSLPVRYGGAVPRRMRPLHLAPASLPVRARSGAAYDLAGTAWATCDPDSPAPGQSFEHVWSFSAGLATIRHDVHTAATDCTGPADPAQHFEIAMTLSVAADLTVGWAQPAPAGEPAQVTATGVGFSLPAAGATKGVAFVDDTLPTPLLFITNPGDPAPPLDAAGYPTVLPNLSSPRR